MKKQQYSPIEYIVIIRFTPVVNQNYTAVFKMSYLYNHNSLTWHINTSDSLSHLMSFASPDNDFLH